MATQEDPLALAVDYPPSQPLDRTRKQIRILLVEPATAGIIDGGVVKCSRYPAYLDDEANLPKYEALSYVWGDEQLCRIIVVDSVATYVTANLEAALRRLRPPPGEEARHLWIDALCINQIDRLEKEHQVNMMAFIYTKTVHAVFWLGEFSTTGPPRPAFRRPRPAGSLGAAPQQPGTQQQPYAATPTTIEADPNAALSADEAVTAFALLRKMAAGEHYYQIKPPPPERPAEPDGIDPQLLAGNSLHKCMELPWWHRAWTLQEVVLPAAGTLQYGGELLPLRDLLRACESALAHVSQRCCNASFMRGFFTTMMNVQSGRLFVGRIEAFVHTLGLVFRFRVATDPRDKVFALLGLGGASVEGVVAADYGSTPEVVYARTARKLVRATGNLKPLSRPEELDRRTTLPSWVPDFAARVNRSTVLATSWTGHHESFGASRTTRAALKPEGEAGGDDDDGPVLAVTGLSVDRIARAGDVLEWVTQDSFDVDRWRQVVRQAGEVESQGYTEAHMGSILEEISRKSYQTIERWLQIVDEVDQAAEDHKYPTGGSYQDALWRLMAMDCVKEHRDGGIKTRRATPADETACRRTWASAEAYHASRNGFPPKHRRLFVTDSGLIGLGQKELAVGDEVCVLHGGNMPFVLRPRPTQQGEKQAPTVDAMQDSHYTYVGEAYVHGIMDGEALDMGKPLCWITLH